MFLFPFVHRMLQRVTGYPLVVERKERLFSRAGIKQRRELLRDCFCGTLGWLIDDVFSSQPARRVRLPLHTPLELEDLLQRVLLNAATWTGGDVNDPTNWMDAKNWNGGIPGPNTDVTIPNVTNAPVIKTGQVAQCSSITDNGGSPLTIQSGASLEVTGNNIPNLGRDSLWNAGLTVNGVLQVDSPQGNLQNQFQWIGGNIQGAQSGTNPWGIYVCDGALWECWQNAQNLGVNMNVGIDQLHNTPQTQQSQLDVSDLAPAHQLQQNLTLTNNANINVVNKGVLFLLQVNNSANAGGIVVDKPTTSTSQILINSGGQDFHSGDQNGQTLTVQPLVIIQNGQWDETNQNGPDKINFSYQGSEGYAVVVGHNGTLNLGNGVTVIAASGIDLQGRLYVPTAQNIVTSTATVNANILDEFGGNIQIGDASNAGDWAALTVNGNVDIEGGALTMWVGFNGSGNLSNYSRLNVFGQFAVNAKQGEWTSELAVNTILTNQVRPVAGQIVGIVSATTTKTANPNPAAFTSFAWNNYQYAAEALTASGYQLTT